MYDAQAMVGNRSRWPGQMNIEERPAVDVLGRTSGTFTPTRGVRQGDNASPTTFNLVVDQAIREFIARRPASAEPILFADDGALTSYSLEDQQEDIITIAQYIAGYEFVLVASEVQAASSRSTCGDQVQRGGLNRHQVNAAC